MESKLDIQVCVVYSPKAREVCEVTLRLPDSATVLDAIEASGLLKTFQTLEVQAISIGVWGRKVKLSQEITENDRIEIYRPLTVDPKVARRERFAKQGARTTGLFEKKRAGAKAGY
jgi:putative ubiquitin-RnfH superfamily antitoxin RatB of RatAB toxin-antitoxin module